MDRGQWDRSQKPGPGQGGDSGSDPKLILAITVCPLTHPPQGTSPSRSLEPDCHQGSGYWGKIDVDSRLHTVPLRKGSDATLPLADGSAGAGDAFSGGSKPLLGRRQYRFKGFFRS